MKRLSEFTTTLDKETIIKTLRENTYTAESDLKSYIFSKRYFSGQVDSNKIRLKNASRGPKHPSPILVLTISEKDNLTEITIHDDTETEIKADTQLILILTISIAIVILLVGSILSFTHPETYSFPWTFVTSIVVAGFGILNVYLHKSTIELNTRADIDFLVRLLKR
jgi:hypothetical protein